MGYLSGKSTSQDGRNDKRGGWEEGRLFAAAAGWRSHNPGCCAARQLRCGPAAGERAQRRLELWKGAVMLTVG